MGEAGLPPTPSDSPAAPGGWRGGWGRLRIAWGRLRGGWERLGGQNRVLLIAAGATGVLGLVLAGLLWTRCGWAGCPNVDRLRAYQPGKASRLLDRAGRAFAELRPVEGATVPLRRIPKHVRDAFLAIEDQRFYRHDGVDWRRFFGAALANLRRGRVAEGFSTVTMQLARNVFPDRIPAREKSLGRKLLEVRVAYELEHRFDKDEILELYLSHIYFGGGARGIDAAARHYFGIPADRLTLPQAALLAGLIRGPSVYDPRRHPERARERRDLVLTLMEQQARIGPAEAAAARVAPLGVVRSRPPTAAPGLGPYFVEEVRKQLEDRLGERLYDETLEIATTLDSGLQTALEQELERQFKAVEAGTLGRYRGARYTATLPPTENGTPYLQGAAVALEVGSGDVLAWVGGRDFRHSRFDRVKSSQRQAGSAFKPFVYAAALGKGHTLGERLRDEPIQVRLAGNRVWEPQNYDGDYDGVVSVREALVRSKNVPTVRLAMDVGLADVARTAREAGIRSEIDETPAMPLGTVAVSPLELTTAYVAFASLGEVVAPRLVLRVKSEKGEELWTAEAPEKRRALEAGVAFLVTDVLQDAVNRGTGAGVRAVGYDGTVAGKTGTTNDATDAWFVGYTSEVVAGVWMGFDDPKPIMGVASGGRLAAPVWGRAMARAKRESRVGWKPPANVVRLRIDPESGAPLAEGCESEYDEVREYFLRTAIPTPVCPERRGRSLADIFRGWLGGDDDEVPRHDRWPEDVGRRSEPAPPPEYEEAESARRAQRERQRRDQEWEEEQDERREEARKAWEEVRKRSERRLKQWRKEEEKRRREREKDRERRRRGET